MVAEYLMLQMSSVLVFFRLTDALVSGCHAETPLLHQFLIQNGKRMVRTILEIVRNSTIIPS